MSKGPKSKAKPKAKAKIKASGETGAKVQAPEPAAAPPILPQTSAPAAQAAVKPRGSLAAVSVVLFLTVIGVSGYMTWHYWSAIVDSPAPAKKAAAVPSPPAPTPILKSAPPLALNGNGAVMEKMAVESERLRQSLDRLMTRMETIEQAVEDANKLAIATTPPSEKLAADPVMKALTGRLNALEQSGETVKALGDRLDRIEKETLTQQKADADVDAGPIAAAPTDAAFDSNVAASAKLMVLAAANLRQATSSHTPFIQELDALRALAGDDADINVAIVVLAKSAPTGVPSISILQGRFERLAGKIVQASRTRKEAGWFDRVANRLTAMVSWRRIDGKGEETSIDAMVAAAEKHLDKGDLKAAVTVLEGLAGNAKALSVAAPWIGDVKARLAAERAVSSLHRHALSMLSPLKPVKG